MKALNIVISIIFVSFLVSLIKIQLVDNDIYTSGSIVSSYDVVVEPARGDILDRNGNPLVTNKQVNCLAFNAVDFPSGKEQKKRNEIIHSLIKLFEQNDEEYINTLPIIINDDGKVAFEKDKEEDIKWLKSSDMLNLNDYATAQNCMDALIKRYQLEEYSLTDAIKIASVCTQMKKEYFSKSYPYTFAKDVSTKLVSKVMENSDFFKGVDVHIEANRKYVDGTIAPHIIGRTASISPQEYENQKNKYNEELQELQRKKASLKKIEDFKRNRYRITDEVGQFGIEEYAEKHLRGTKGVKTVTADVDGNIKEHYSVEPKQGDTVILTIDKNLQQVAQKALKDRVESLKVSSNLPCAAAVVVLEVKTGDILACATYPSYDISKYSENYSKLAKDSNVPLWNRALKSTYEPGSTFKPLVAIGALETGTITEDTHFTCRRIFDYKGTRFICQGYHGSLDVVEAINKSCNIFFYQTGRRLGIENIDKYGSLFGLGQATGVELPEASGLIASKEYKESKGKPWLPGDTVQAAIGQSDNLFTPLQLANYVSTIASGGTRYVPHFIKSVKSYDYTQTMLEKEPEVAVKTGVSSKNLELVKQGMLKVGTVGFCRRAFSGLPVKAAAKTGTSEIVKKINGRYIEGNNGFLITFAPYENPEIAMAVVVETADKGSQTAVVARDIYQYYFENKGVKTAQNYNQLLS